MAGGKKLCVTCGTKNGAKPLEEFHYKNKAKGTRQDRCMECAKAYAKAHYDLHKEQRLAQINERQRAMREANRKVYEEFLNLGKCSVCGEEDFRCLTSNISNDDITFRTTEDLKAIVAQGVIKCLNCDAKSTPI